MNRPSGRSPAIIVFRMVAIICFLAVFATTASAQLPALDRFLNTPPSAEETSGESTAQSRPTQSTPSQSLPQRFQSAEPASAEDYSRILTSRPVPGLPAGSTLEAPFTLDSIEDYVDVFRARLLAIVYKVPSAFGELTTTMQAASPTGRPVHFLGIAAFAGLLLIAGRAVTELFNVFIARPIFVRMQRPNPAGYGEKLPVLAMRLFLSLIAIVVCLSTAAAAGVAFHDGHQPTLATVMAVFGAYAAIIMMHTFWRMVLAPFLPEYRLPAVGDREARAVYRWLSMSSIAAILAAAFSHWIAALGLPREVLVVVTASATLLATVLLCVSLRANRRTITAILLGGGRGAGPEAAAMASRQAEALAAPRTMGERTHPETPRGKTEPRPQTWLQQIVALSWEPAAYLALLVTWGELAFRLVMGIETGAERIMAPFFVLVAVMVVYATVVFASDRIFARRRAVRRLNAASRAAEAEEASRQSMASAPNPVTPDTPFAGPAALPSAQPAAADPAPSARGIAEGDAGLRAARDVDGRLGRTDGPTVGSGDGQGGGDDEYSGGPPAMAVQGIERDTGGMRSFEDLARRVASLLALGTGLWITLWYWGGQEVFAESAFFGIAQDVVDIVFLGYVVFHAVRIWLDQKIQEEGGHEDVSASMLEGEGGGAGATRLATLLPLLRNFILGFIGVTVVLLIAIELGVNVAPLFAGAGIVGLAIGFGAQTLVRDIISGAFFLVDDAFRKGEYIDVGSVKGTVEKISIRSFQLRHHLGMLHTIPFGEIQYLTNFSRDWVMMKLPLRLTYDTDVERVRKLIKKLGIRLMEDPTVGHLFLQPLKSQGVIQMEDSAMIVRVKFMTRPGDQWVTRKRVFAEIRELFEEEGISFAHREVTVRIPDIDKRAEPLQEDDRKAIGAATRANLDVIEAEALRKTGTGGPMDDR
ncbi:MAG: mechanosensitive ion channel family protein [Pseudomonadota bacterium]